MSAIHRVQRLVVVAAAVLVGACQAISGLDDLRIDRADDDPSPDRTSDSTRDTDSSDAECTIPSGMECAPATNCGCKDDEACALSNDVGELSVSCQKPGKAKLGDSCRLGECDRGLLCVDGVCAQACRLDGDCEQSPATCSDVPRPNGGTLRGVRYCEASCDLVSPSEPHSKLTPCKEGQTCVLTASGARCLNHEGDATQGETCKTAADCAAGFTCNSGQCKRWCSLDEAQCDRGTECVASDAVSNDRGLGLCEQSCPASLPEGDECLTFPDCGCSEGKTCRPLLDGTRVCSSVGTTPVQGVCSRDEDCEVGTACVGGLCRLLCDPSSSVCSDRSQCVQLQADEEPIEGSGACLGACDPVYPDTDNTTFTPCGPGAECVPGFVDGPLTRSYCQVSDGEGELTGPCESDKDCAEGALCLSGRCHPLCRRDENCDGLTLNPICFSEKFPLRGSDEDDVIGVCCSPLPGPGSECSAFGLECGCNDGFTCRNGGREGQGICSPIGNTGYQARCCAEEDCGAESSCVGGLCRPHCDGTCPAKEGACIQVHSDNVPLPFAMVCAGRCDPVNPTSSNDEFRPCGALAHCIAGWNNGVDALELGSFCASRNDCEQDPSPYIPEGGDCSFDTDCQIGLACDFRACPVDDAECTGVCTKYCYGDDDCDGSTCALDVGRQAAPGKPVGYCEVLVLGPAPSSSAE
jgi:hypothetical protein